MTYTGRQYQIAEDTAPPKETNPAVVPLSDGTDVQVIRLDTGTDTTPTPASVSAPVPTADAPLLAELQLKADLTENQPVTIYDSTNTNAADVISYEGDKSLRVIIGYQPTFTVHLSADNQSGTVGYMLIDLSDTTNWPHTNTGHIILKNVVIDTNTDAAFVGDLLFGFLSGVDATNGDFHQIGILHGQRASDVGAGAYDFASFGFGLETDEWFGPTLANDTTWQTDVNLLGPDGASTHPAGDGDLVMKLVSSAGTADIGVTITYTTAT